MPDRGAGHCGVVNRILLDLGLVGAPGRFLYNELGVIIAPPTCCCPSSCCRCSPPWSDRRPAAAGRGIARPSRGTVFRRVFLPAQRPGAGAGSILVFILTSLLHHPALLGGGRVPMVANALDL